MAAIAAAACTKERVDFPEEPVEISYQVVQKAPVTKAGFPTDSKFLSWAYYLGKSKTWDADKNDAMPYLSNVEISYDDSNSKWWNYNGGTGGVHYYWPEEGTLTFFAASPDTVANVGCGEATGITVNNFEAGNTDLLVADIAKDQTSATAATTSGVNTVFRHKLTKVQLAAMTVENYGETFKITNLTWKISKVYGKGSYAQISGSISDKWTVNVDAINIKEFEFTGLAEVTSARALSNTEYYMIPQANTEMNGDAKIEIGYKVTMKGSDDNTITYDKTASYALKGDGAPDWGVNKSITYVLKFNGPDEILWNPSIEDWSTTTDTPVVIN